MPPLLAFVNPILLTAYLVALFSLVIFIYLAFSLWSLKKRLRRLTAALPKLKSGDLDVNLSIFRDRTIGPIAHAFDDVIRLMKKNSQTLEQTVADKTRQLTDRVRKLQLQNKLLEQSQHDLELTTHTIKQNQAQHAAMLSSIGDGVVVVNREERIELINPPALDMLGCSETEAQRHKIADIVHMYDAKGNFIEFHKRPIAKALAVGDQSTTTEFYYQRPDQTRFPVAITTTPIFLDSQILGAIEIFRDITLQKEVDLAKTEFVSLASHQLRTPLTAISWSAERMGDPAVGELNDKQRHYLDNIYAGNQRMINLVNALLNVSRIELGAFSVQPRPVNLIELAQTVVDELATEVAAKNLWLDTHYPDQLPEINLDPELTRIILQNLLTNAVKYTPAGGRVQLEITIDNENILIKVADSGVGIPADEQDKIFGKMFRASNVRAEDNTGTGLGLYIIKSILEKSGGRIWFESTEGQGTTFYVEVPRTGMVGKTGTKKLV